MSDVRTFVLFHSSFRYESAPNISHEATDAKAERTYCGRLLADAATVEPDTNDLEPDCRTCARKARKLREQRNAIVITDECVFDGDS